MLAIGKERGFTLLEVLIIIALITAMITINLVNFEQFLISIETRGEVQKIEHFFKGIRERSITQQQEKEIKINDNTLLYRQDDNTIVNYDLNIVSRTMDKIIYYPDGTSSGGNFSIKILDKHLYTIYINQISGKLEWKG